VVLETNATREKKEGTDSETAKTAESQSAAMTQVPLFNEEKKPRPRHVPGKTYRTETPAGTTYVTINENGYGEGQPFEVFVLTAKAGSEVMAIAEALGRLMSYILRISSPVSPRKRLKEIVRQLNGIGGERSTGFGPNRVRSLPDGLAQILQEYLDESAQVEDAEQKPRHSPLKQQELPIQGSVKKSEHSGKQPLGDLCPSCGAATLVNEEGCRKCYSCSFSEC
ncbi:MAG TPA: hypothetical protein VJZ27_08295, partial [Aggregatilineales bacterium]|nr:hypothetical protein [Aggregatilineales bacterium]